MATSVSQIGTHDQYIIADYGGSLYVHDTVIGRNGDQVIAGVGEFVFSDGVAVFDPTGTAGRVARLYGAELGRAPDRGGLVNWTTQIDNAQVPLDVVASSFATSPEFIATYGSLADAAFVNQLYQNVLGRAADAAGAQNWIALLTSGASRGQVVVGFSESPENRIKTLGTAGDPNDAEAYRLYPAAFNRAPDAAGHAYWSSALASGVTPTQVAQGFVDSAEFAVDYAGMSSSEFVTTLYNNVLHRAPEAAGLANWTTALQNGASKASVLVGFSDSLENRLQTAAATHGDWVFVPTPSAAAPASADNTYRVGSGAFVVDRQGNTYAINPSGQITINGKIDPTTAHVSALGYANGVVWQKNDNNDWYSKSSVDAPGVNYPVVNGVPPIRTQPDAFESPPPPSFTQDTVGNQWQISPYSSSAGKVMVNGTIDWTTDRVVKLSYVNGVMWQENADGDWYGKVKPSDTWGMATRTDPSVAAQDNTLTWTDNSTDPTQAIAWRLPSGAFQAPVPHETLSMSGGTMNLGGGNLAGDVLHTHATATITPTINMTNGSSLKLDAGGADVGVTNVHVTGGTAALNVSGFYSDIVVTADAISSVILNADMAFRGSLTETGGTVVVNGASHFVGSTVRLTSNLASNGLLAVSGARSSFGTLEVDGAIGAGVTLAATGTDAAILLDRPTLDQGTITLSYAQLEIKGEAEADSVSYKDSLVSLYHGNTLLSSLKVIGLPGQGYSPNSANDGTLHFGKSAGGSVFAYNDSPSDFIPDLSTTTTPLAQHV